jgi:segregation and condensation protein B
VQLDGVVQGAIEALRESYMDRGSGLEIMEVAGGYQMRSVRRAAPYITRALGVRPVRLSKAAVETLAIVAYRQPVARQEIEELRGVDCGGVLRSLVTRGLVKLAGRKDTPGRPLLYGTGQDFLQFFGLTDLSDLPTLRDLRELREDDPQDGPVPLSPEF